MKRLKEREDVQPPICPACGVTMGLVIADSGDVRFVCLECGFSDDDSGRRDSATVRADAR